MIRTPVLVVGGGLAGLSSAMLLAWRGVQSLVVERHASTARWPQARGVNPCTLEVLRVVPGFEDDLRAVSPPSFVDFKIVIAESVTGRELKVILPPRGLDTSAISPAPMSGAGQDRIEQVLLQHARRLGADVRFSTVMERFSQDAEGVNATVRDMQSGAETQVHADYLIAADGNRSGIRKSLGIGVHGSGTLSNNMMVFFEANLQGIVKHSGFVLCYLQNPKFAGAFITSDDPNVGAVSVEYDPQKESVADYTEERCVEMVRAAMGVPDLELKVLDVKAWEMSARVANRLQSGRVFLVGDAAHTMPPTGGLGGQTAMQDAADLAWKLALVLQHKAGPQLLDTYEMERHPVAEITVARQVANYVERMRPDRSELNAPGTMGDVYEVAGGYRYRSAAIIPDTVDDGQPTENPFHPTGRPGFRMPYVWLERDGVRVSTLDLVGHEFVLFAGREGDAWAEAAHQTSNALGITVECFRIGVDLIDPHSHALTRLGITECGASLVRPDGFVAWRCRDGDANAFDILMDVLHHILFRSTQSCEASRPRAPSRRDGDHPTFSVSVSSFA